MTSENLELWNKVSATPPSATKTSTLGGRTITSINLTYMVEKATEVFGPLGSKWGYLPLEERIDEGAPILKDGSLVCYEKVNTIKLALWYLADDGEQKQVIHYGHTPFVYNTRRGVITDHEASKKSLSDAIKKCLFMLGFCADINKGLFDDQDYVAEAQLKEELTSDEAKAQKAEELKQWVADQCKSFELLPNVDALFKVWQACAKRIAIEAPLVGLIPEVLREQADAAYFRQEKALTRVEEAVQ